MEKVKIYLSGGMTGLSYEEYMRWRKEIINHQIFIMGGLKKEPIFFNPPDYYNFEQEDYVTEKEVMEFDLYNLRNSDIVIVNFNAPDSIGTAMELMLAKEFHIPIIGIDNQDDKEIHPWLVECVSRLCLNLEEAVSYVKEFYLS